MWHFRAWFSRHGGAGLTVGLDDRCVVKQADEIEGELRKERLPFSTRET